MIKLKKRKVRQVNGMRIGDPIYYKEIRYEITYFSQNRKTLEAKKIEDTPEGHKTIVTNVKNVESVY